jgi:iron complex outermembrane receptor protein
MYGELALPLTRQLEGQVALRYDRYSDMGTALTPKLGLKFKPMPGWLLRATWGRGFKAPTLPEVTSALSFLPGASVTDPQSGAVSTVVVSLGGNPDLEPEKSRTFTAGLVFEPTPSFSLGVDVYQIKWSNRVAFEDLQAVANNPNDPRVFRDPVSGLIRAVSLTYINLNEISTQGVDVDVRYKASTAYGRFGTRLAANYVDSYEVEGTEYAGTDGAWLVSSASAVPRWKGQWSVDWERGPWTAQLTLNYMHHYWRTYGMTVAPSFFRPGAATLIPQTGQLDQKSPSYTTLDLYARYSVTPKFSVNGSIVNLTDEMPPFDPSFSTTYFHDRGTGFDVRGRIYRLGGQYRF